MSDCLGEHGSLVRQWHVKNALIFANDAGFLELLRYLPTNFYKQIAKKLAYMV